MDLWDTITDKDWWIKIAVIVISVMLFESKVSEFILTKIQLNETLLSLASLLIIVAVTELLSDLVLDT